MKLDAQNLKNHRRLRFVSFNSRKSKTQLVGRRDHKISKALSMGYSFYFCVNMSVSCLLFRLQLSIFNSVHTKIKPQLYHSVWMKILSWIVSLPVRRLVSFLLFPMSYSSLRNWNQKWFPCPAYFISPSMVHDLYIHSFRADIACFFVTPIFFK